MNCYIRVAMALVCCVAGTHERELAYNTTAEPNPCAPGPVPTPAPVAPVSNPCAPGPVPTPAPVSIPVVTTVTTTPGTTVTTTPGTTVTTTPGTTVTTTPGTTVTTTPGTTVTTTPQTTVTTKFNPCVAAKYAVDEVAAKNKKIAADQLAAKKGQSLIQRMENFPIASGFFGLLLASAALGMVLRIVASRRRSGRVSFVGRAVAGQEGDYESVSESDLESNQALMK